MGNVIYRYNVELQEVQDIYTIDGEVLKIGDSKRGLSMWVRSRDFADVSELDDKPDVLRRIHLANTGAPHSIPASAKYAATTFQGDYVFHLFIEQ